MNPKSLVTCTEVHLSSRSQGLGVMERLEFVPKFFPPISVNTCMSPCE